MEALISHQGKSQVSNRELMASDGKTVYKSMTKCKGRNGREDGRGRTVEGREVWEAHLYFMNFSTPLFWGHLPLHGRWCMEHSQACSGVNISSSQGRDGHPRGKSLVRFLTLTVCASWVCLCLGRGLHRSSSCSQAYKACLKSFSHLPMPSCW